MKNLDQRNRIIEYSLKLNSTNLSPLRSGNISLRVREDDKDGYLITPSGKKYEKLKPEDIQGGTYTVTNVGSFGNVMGTPIINQPQVAILALGAIRKVPAVIETPHGDFIGIRHKMYLSHSYDHRVVDGALGGRFVRKVADYLEEFNINRDI